MKLIKYDAQIPYSLRDFYRSDPYTYEQLIDRFNQIKSIAGDRCVRMEIEFCYSEDDGITIEVNTWRNETEDEERQRKEVFRKRQESLKITMAKRAVINKEKRRELYEKLKKEFD
jgi:hypothetical protein